MASLQCENCGKGIFYHGESNHIEYYLFEKNIWHEITSKVFDKNNKRFDEFGCPISNKSDNIIGENEGKYIEMWKCPNCDSFNLFGKDGIEVEEIWIPMKDTNCDENEIEKEYILFDDVSLNKIIEAAIPNNEIDKKFKPLFYVEKGKKYMIFYEDENKAMIKKVYQRQN